MPCGPWGDWGRCNLAKGGAAAATVYEAQEATRPLPALADQMVVGSVSRGRHVLLEQPLGSSAYNEPEMKRAREVVEKGAA
eukprot:308451-Pyramimonas_sp.AAC.1